MVSTKPTAEASLLARWLLADGTLQGLEARGFAAEYKNSKEQIEFLDATEVSGLKKLLIFSNSSSGPIRIWRPLAS